MRSAMGERWRPGQVRVTPGAGDTDATVTPARPGPVRGDFAAIYDAHAGSLFRYALRRLGPHLAEDVVSETFLAAFAGWRGYDPRLGEVRPWLFGILSRKIARHHRDEVARLRTLGSMPGLAPASDIAEQVADMVTAQAARQLLSRALAGLKPADRDVLLLVAWAELSYPEVAAVLQIPVGTVGSRLNRARRRVRDQLPDQGRNDHG